MVNIEFNMVSKSYLQTSYNFVISSSELFLVTGGNGTGKTTLIRLVLGLIFPDSGQIYKSKFKTAYLPEKTELPPEMKVIDYLFLLAKIKKSPLSLMMLKDFNVPYYQTIKCLSKGNKQKIGLIQTLLGDEDLLVFDEPLSGLDKKATKAFIKYLKKKLNSGKCIIVSTHFPENFDFCTKRLILS